MNFRAVNKATNVAGVILRSSQSRTLSELAQPGGNTQHAMEKLRGTFEEYRRQNFSRETPERFKKELVKAAGRNKIGLNELNTILTNIGATDQRLSNEEMDVVLKQAGVKEGDRDIPAEKMIELL